MSRNEYLSHPEIKKILFDSFANPNEKFDVQLSARKVAELLRLLTEETADTTNSKDYFIRQLIRSVTPKNNLNYVEEIFIEIEDKEDEN
jgi:hypothetical protein